MLHLIVTAVRKATICIAISVTQSCNVRNRANDVFRLPVDLVKKSRFFLRKVFVISLSTNVRVELRLPCEATSCFGLLLSFYGGASERHCLANRHTTSLEHTGLFRNALASRYILIIRVPRASPSMSVTLHGASPASYLKVRRPRPAVQIGDRHVSCMSDIPRPVRKVSIKVD